MNKAPDSTTNLAGTSAETAIPRLLDAHGGRIYALARRLCRSPEEAEDLVQEIFLQAFRKWDQFDGRSSPTSWLFTIAVRACRRMHRRRAGQPTRIESLDELLPFGEAKLAATPGPHTEAARHDQQEAIERVQAAIADLPAEFRLPLILKDVLELSVADVATALEIKPATVKTRLHRARLRLRKALLEGLPQRDAPAPVYTRQVCLDLLAAKQDALDRDTPFPVGDDVICERCRSVFASLDWERNICRELGAGRLPGDVRSAVIAKVTGG